MGDPCSRGHSGERYVRDGSCVECERERRRKARKQNPKELARKRKQNQKRAVQGLDPDLAEKRAETFRLESERRKQMAKTKKSTKKTAKKTAAGKGMNPSPAKNNPSPKKSGGIDLMTLDGTRTALNDTWDEYCESKDRLTAHVKSGLIGRGIAAQNLEFRQEQARRKNGK